jgi:signal transduction histidine kinase
MWNVVVEKAGRNGRAVVHGVVLFALGPVELLLFVAQVVSVLVAGVGLVFFFHPVIKFSRRVVDLARRLAGDWCGTVIPSPYQPQPAAPVPGPDGTYRSRDGRHVYTNPWLPTFERNTNWLMGDTATWRDLAWLLVNPVVGGVLAVLPAVLVGGGVYTVVVGSSGRLGLGLGPWHWVVGLVSVVVGLLIAPVVLRLHGLWAKSLLRPASAASLARGQARRHWFENLWRALGHSIVFGLLSLVAVPVLMVCLLAMLGGSRVARPVEVWARWLPNLFRRLGADWAGLELPRPYVRRSEASGAELSGKRDPAARRDLLWLACQPVVGGLCMLLPLAFIGYCFWGLGLWGTGDMRWHRDVYELFGSVPAAIVGGFVLFFVALLTAPRTLRLHGQWLPTLLGLPPGVELPAERSEREQLVARVEQLTETRAAATDTQAAEVRRIERDLHDGAQARLVAMGMTLGAVEALIDQDPEAAKKLVAQVRDTTGTALAELRGLVRGIHPPVLAERGLVDAVRALALDSPLRVQVSASVPGHAEPPVESAVYFAVAEMLTNAARHSGAEHVWIDLRHSDGELRISVLDDGGGGADPGRGSGLRGVERRLGTFDGRLTLSSPVGGPTMVTMEVPCVLSSPRTSTSCETG